MESQGYKEKTVVLQDEGLRKLKGFVQIPRFILLHDKLSYGAKVAYGILLGYAWQDGFCFPAQQALAVDLGLKERQVRNLLAELKKHGLVDWKQQGLNKPNIYYLLPIKLPGDIPERQYFAAPERQYSSYPDRQDIADYIYSKNNKQNNVNVDKEGGGEGRESKTVLHDLPNLNQPPEKTSYIVEDILKALGDAQSKPFYTLVAAKIPESVIRQKLSEIKQGGARSPAKVFASVMKDHAAIMLNKQRIQALSGQYGAIDKLPFSHRTAFG